MTSPTDFRAAVLSDLGATGSEIDELLAYNQNTFNHADLSRPLVLPLADESFATVWEKYAVEAQEKGAWACLRERLVQLRFPIQAGISQTPAYRAATRQGRAVEGVAEATGLRLNAPEGLQLALHQSPAGRIPLLITGDRADFVALVQALTHANEPHPIPDSMGAAMVAGYNNWERVRQYRQQWQQSNPFGNWAEEFKRLAEQPELYQDRFIILSDGPYSGVTAPEMGLSVDKWQQVSLTIRREHECAHYFTRRVFGVMRNNLLDELIADYMGIAAAAGNFRADWFLRFMGLENYPAYRPGGRLENYPGQPPLSAGAVRVLQTLVKQAAENLAAFDAAQQPPRERMLLALSYMTLEELASAQAESYLQQALVFE
ncbi:MAG: hypothetical protein JXM69_13045 [Anaerolineae bacterium]|nr:hypothetical protein [Anaerolineae bacterium]